MREKQSAPSTPSADGAGSPAAKGNPETVPDGVSDGVPDGVPDGTPSGVHSTPH